MVTNPFAGGLSMRISASTRDFERGVDNAQRSLAEFGAGAVGTLGPLQALQGRADEAGDELADVGREAGQAAVGLGAASAAAGGSSGAFTSLAASTEGLSLSFGSLTSSLSGTLLLLGGVTAAATGLLSALVPLVSVLGTLTVGAGALAGAFGTVIGTGILAFGDKLAEQNSQRLEQLEETRSELEAEAAVLEAKIDNLRGAADAGEELTKAQNERLNTLIQERNETGQLIEAKEAEIKKTEEQTSITGALQGAMAGLGRELRPIIVDFGRQFVPLIEDAIAAIPQLVRNIFDAAGGMGVFVDALRDFGREAFRVIPQVVAFARDFAAEALPAARGFFGWIRDNASGIFDEMLSATREVGPELLDLADSFANALPDIQDLGEAILEDVLPFLSDLVDDFGDFADMVTPEKQEQIGNFASAIGDIVPEIKDVVGELLDLIPMLIFLADRVLPVLQPAFESLETVLDGIETGLSAINDAMSTLIDRWKDLPKPLREAIVQGAELAVRRAVRSPVGPGGAVGAIRGASAAAPLVSGENPIITSPEGQSTRQAQNQTNVEVNVRGTTPLARAFNELIEVELKNQGDQVFNQTGSR